MAVVAASVAAGCASPATDPVSTPPPTTVGTIDPDAYLEEVLALVRERAYFADRIDFDALRERAAVVAAEADDVSETYGFVASIVVSLHDRHSSFLTPDELRSLTSDDDQPSAVPTAPVVDGVLYLTLPGIGADPQSVAGVAYIDGAHRAIAEQEACGVVLDLTNNGGGNVFTMLSALAPVLGPGPTLGYQRRDGDTITYLVETDGSVTGGDEVLAPAPDTFDPLHLPIAVLQATNTASSGEAIVMATLGRPDSRTFGTPTKGIPTGNDLIELPDGSALLLTTSVGVDFGGVAHETAISPQHRTAGPDSAREAATSWVQQKQSCAADE
jgi:hypothetical protein